MSVVAACCTAYVLILAVADSHCLGQEALFYAIAHFSHHNNFFRDIKIMTTFTFLGSQISYSPTRLKTPVDVTHGVKYRGSAYEPHQSIATTVGQKGLKFRGVAY